MASVVAAPPLTMAAGVAVAVKPRYGAYLVAAAAAVTVTLMATEVAAA